jgi:hypothetical protein
MPTPRDLDPKFKDAKLPENATEETTEEAAPQLERVSEYGKVNTEVPGDYTNATTQIVERRMVTNSDGTVSEEWTKPISVNEWKETN